MRSRRRALLIPADPQLEQALRQDGVEPCRTAACGSCGAAVLQAPLEASTLRAASSALGARGRVFALVPEQGLPEALLALSRHHWEPKRLLLNACNNATHSPANVVIVAAQGRKGGLVVERLRLC